MEEAKARVLAGDVSYGNSEIVEGYDKVLAFKLPETPDRPIETWEGVSTKPDNDLLTLLGFLRDIKSDRLDDSCWREIDSLLEEYADYLK